MSLSLLPKNSASRSQAWLIWRPLIKGSDLGIGKDGLWIVWVFFLSSSISYTQLLEAG